MGSKGFQRVLGSEPKTALEPFGTCRNPLEPDVSCAAIQFLQLDGRAGEAVCSPASHRSLHMRTRVGFVALILLGLLVSGSSLGAQTQITTGTIQGTVTDPSDAALPGVTVEARNTATNVARSVVTGPDGRFVLLQLPPGPTRSRSR